MPCPNISAASLLDVTALIDFHARTLLQPARLPRSLAPTGALWTAITDNHAYNTRLWNEEDQARRTDVPAETIMACKRRIDRYNQCRNDAVEAIDDALLAQLSAITPATTARLHSETAGAMIDRLSILALKLHHMAAQTKRTEVDDTHRARCAQKLQTLRRQRDDLAACLSQLLDDVAAGRAVFRAYRQFKMYNDPALNPWLSPPSHGAG